MPRGCLLDLHERIAEVTVCIGKGGTVDRGYGISGTASLQDSLRREQHMLCGNEKL